jgi:hypothetical protein
MEGKKASKLFWLDGLSRFSFVLHRLQRTTTAKAIYHQWMFHYGRSGIIYDLLLERLSSVLFVLR